MKRALLAIFAVAALGDLSALPAQESPFLPAGYLVRVRETDQHSPWISGTVVHANSSRVVMAVPPADTLAFNLDSIYRLDASRGPEKFNSSGAVRGAGIGLALGAVIGLSPNIERGDERIDGELGAFLAGIGALGGAAIGGGGWRALRGGFLGAAGGVPLGVVIGLLAHDTNSSSPRSDSALFGALLGGVSGGGLGMFVGAVIPAVRWETMVSKDFDLRVAADPGGGARLRVSIAF